MNLFGQSTRRYWIGVASADHARRGSREGFMQVCHGKGGPLKRLSEGDGIVYYSPSITMGGKDRLQAFTSIGFVRDARVYQVEMLPSFIPFRRDVDYLPSNEVPIHSLLEQLEFTRGKKNWGYSFRFGILEISEFDFITIAKAMDASIDNLSNFQSNSMITKDKGDRP